MNSKNYFNSSEQELSRVPEVTHKEGVLGRIMSGEDVGVNELEETIEQLRIEAADSFAQTKPEECEHWARAYQYGYWVSRLEATRDIDEKVQQVVNFEQGLGLPPELPKYGVELLNTAIERGEQ